MLIQSLLPFIAAVLLTLLLMPLVMRLAHRIGAVDHPDARKVHRQVTPRMGGLGFLLTLLVLPLTILDMGVSHSGFVAGLIVVGITGILDDMFEISPRWKFAGIFLGSGLFLYLSGTSIANVGNLFGFGDIETGWFALPFTLFAMVGFINALNLSDGLDGLAAGIALIAAFFLAAFALAAADASALLLAVILCGSLVGFLYFNAHPARVFMGDTGSLTLGYVLAAITLMLLKSSGGEGISPISMGILLGLPLADTIYVMGRRLAHGTSPFDPDKTHFHHRLLEIGASHAGTVSVFYLMAFIYGGAAFLLIGRAEWVQSLVLAVLLALTYLLLGRFEGAEMTLQFSGEPAEKDMHEVRHDSHPVFYRMTHWLGASIPYVTWLLPMLLLPPLFTLQPSGLLAQIVLFTAVLALVLYPWRGNHDSTWAQGLIYMLIFSLVLVINFQASPVMRDYLHIATMMLALWVALKLWFKRNLRVFLTTGLESLLLMLSWVMPWVGDRVLALQGEIQLQLYEVSLQGTVFLLATKIVLRRQPRRNTTLLQELLLISGVALLGLL